MATFSTEKMGKNLPIVEFRVWTDDEDQRRISKRFDIREGKYQSQVLFAEKRQEVAKADFGIAYPGKSG
ncbi:MAG TPA: hypothetical protein VL221_13355 [Bacteroidota bacterium]|nr:hypothetical protein [Bacteroidota bacterium]